DKLLELGFLEQTDEIFATCSNLKLQIVLFNAMLPSGVESLANFIYVGQEEGKLLAVCHLIQEGLKPSEHAKELFRKLIYDGINVDSERTRAQLLKISLYN
ncbi:24635_t:CDS:2, partial [Entrophospora sp. SA101]